MRILQREYPGVQRLPHLLTGRILQLDEITQSEVNAQTAAALGPERSKHADRSLGLTLERKFDAGNASAVQGFCTSASELRVHAC